MQSIMLTMLKFVQTKNWTIGSAGLPVKVFALQKFSRVKRVHSH